MYLPENLSQQVGALSVENLSIQSIVQGVKINIRK